MVYVIQSMLVNCTFQCKTSLGNYEMRKYDLQRTVQNFFLDFIKFSTAKFSHRRYKPIKKLILHDIVMKNIISIVKDH